MRVVTAVGLFLPALTLLRVTGGDSSLKVPDLPTLPPFNVMISSIRRYWPRGQEGSQLTFRVSQRYTYQLPWVRWKSVGA